MGDEQKVGYEELLAQSRAAFEEVPDFTLAVEEEFALLDPATLGLVNRFEEVQAAAKGTDLEQHLVGELIASEVEVRTGRCDTFADAMERIGERRAQLRALTDGLGIGLSAVGTHPWSPWQEQRIIDTPHYRRNDELLRYVVWRNNTFGLHVHVGINGADRAIARLQRAARASCRSCSRCPRARRSSRACTRTCTRRARRSSRACSRAAAIPDAFDGWAEFERYVRFLYETGSIDRAHAALVERPPAPRLPDGRDPDLRRAARHRRGAVARGARSTR